MVAGITYAEEVKLERFGVWIDYDYSWNGGHSYNPLHPDSSNSVPEQAAPLHGGKERQGQLRVVN